MNNQTFCRGFIFIAAGILFVIGSSHVTAQTEISGYLQAEWQQFDLADDPNDRGVYENPRKNFFTIRRGRIKAAHTQDEKYTGVVQIDATETGVSIKDAYLNAELLKEDRLDVTVGLFNRPNYEVELSSRKRESTERSQVVRAFYPGERDLGFMFTTAPKLADRIKPKLQVGLFNGNGIAVETDPYKEITARLTLPLPFNPEGKIAASIGGLIWIGGIAQPEDSVLRFENGAEVVAFEQRSDSWPGWGNRSHAGVEAQLAAKLFSFGATELRGEYLTGTRPEEASRTIFVEVSEGDSIILEPRDIRTLRLRDQTGFYIMLVQTFGKHLKVAGKYDVFDRNTNLSGTEVSSSKDRSSSIIGFGLIGDFGPIRLTGWYEIPSYAADEARFTDGGGTIHSGDLKDNKATVRFQYTLN